MNSRPYKKQYNKTTVEKDNSQPVIRENAFPEILDEVYINMFHTSKIFFALRTISLLDGEIFIFKALPISDKTARYVLSQEKAIDHTIGLFGIEDSHVKMYEIQHKGLIEAVYRGHYHV